jgi:hypothetical protein
MFADAILGHLIGDYLLQNDWMALNKKSNSLICALHCLIWTIWVCGTARLGPVAFAVLFVTHFAQDRTQIIAWWMDGMGQKQFRTGACAPWSSIVVDNVWHLVVVWLVVRFLG